EVPARLFVPRDGGARYRDDRRDAGGGFTAIDLRARSDRTVMTLRAVVPPAKDAAAELDLAPLRSGDAASATLTWRVRANDRCLKGSGECRGHGRRCRS
ncbi:MAG TPA: hypothetical protein VKA21_13015, partial [Candidatus Binatia bacterium]|nr:hypothetical protein [Candidatus Binatia bacterium]